MRGPCKVKNRRILACVLGILLIGVFSANAAQPVVFKGPHEAKKTLAAETVAKSISRDEEPYVYDPKGKPDPFKSFIAKQEAFEKKRKRRKPRTYLETLELSQLDLIAIVVGPRGRWAMVRDSKGVGHVIKEGTAVGTNGGVVYKITPDRVIIREHRMDFRGKKITKDIVKKLHASKQ